MENNRDPVYESEDEPEWTPEELGKSMMCQHARRGSLADLSRPASVSYRTKTVGILIPESSDGFEGCSKISREWTVLQRGAA